MKPHDAKPSRRRVVASALAWVAVAPRASATTATTEQTAGTAPASVEIPPVWTTLPPTPDLPTPDKSETLPINGTPIFYARFGQGQTVVLLHGGMANANYWGQQIRHLADRFCVVAMDTRGHGRSPLTSSALGYELFAQDVVGLMDALEVPKASVIGWSDGAITGLELAMAHPNRVTRLFAFGGNLSHAAQRRCAGACPTFVDYARRCRTEYDRLSPLPDKWPDLMSGLHTMWRGQQDFTRAELARVKAPTVIADGAHDEIIKPTHAAEAARMIPSARPLLLPNTSHFAMLQDPDGFNAALDRFMTIAV